MSKPFNYQDAARMESIGRELNELHTRRNAALDNLQSVLVAAGFEPGAVDSNQMAKSADAIRDALAPFDSGVRLDTRNAQR